MAAVLNDTSTHAVMSARETKEKAAFAKYYTGTSEVADARVPKPPPPPPIKALPVLPAGHKWVSIELDQDGTDAVGTSGSSSNPLYFRTSCLRGYGSAKPADLLDLGDMTFDLQPALNKGKAAAAGLTGTTSSGHSDDDSEQAISLSVWEEQGGLPCHYGKECPYFVVATKDGAIAVHPNDGSAAFKNSASFSFTAATGELRAASGGLVYITETAKPPVCEGDNNKPAGHEYEMVKRDDKAFSYEDEEDGKMENQIDVRVLMHLSASFIANSATL